MAFICTTIVTPSLSFRLRTTKTDGQGMVYCRLRFNKELTNEYKVSIIVPIDCWPALPPSHPQSAGIRLQLAQIRADHQWIALNLPDPSANSIKAAWLQGVAKSKQVASKSPLISEAYNQHLQYLTTPPARNNVHWRPPAEKTINNRTVVGRHLAQFLKVAGKNGLRLSELRAAHGYQFADYLFDHGLNADTVVRYLRCWSDSIDYAARYNEMVNPLLSLKIKGLPPKRIDYLSSSDLIRLSTLKLDKIQNVVRNWALFMAYTGMDYHDALMVTADLGKYYRKGEHGDTIVFQRLKYDRAPQWGECHLPIMPATKELLSDVLNWPRPKLKVINTHLKKIAKHLKIEFNLSAKVLRKTAAVEMLLYYEDIYLVQKAMGHQSLATTQKFYLMLPPEVVHGAMKRRNERG